MRHPRTRFIGVPIIMTSNRLPKVLREPKEKPGEEAYEFKERENDYGALKSRCKLVHLEKTHSNREKFPYIAEELGIYMYDYLKFSKDKPAGNSFYYYNPYDGLNQMNFFNNEYIIPSS